MNRTDGSFWEKSWEIGFPDGYVDDYKRGGEGWQERALLAHKDGGAVRLFELARILSENNDWSLLLEGLWETCGFNSSLTRRDFPEWNKCFLLDSETLERAWLWVLARLTTEEKDLQGGRESFYFGKLSEQYPVSAYRLNIYSLASCDEACRIAGFDRQTPDCFIMIDQFQRQIFGIYQLCKSRFKGVDFPKPLITPQAAPGTQAALPLSMKKERKKTPDQRARLKCKDIAEEKWISAPSMTIADMIMIDEIEEACMKIAGKSYTEKVLWKWIKEVCPNRKGGRRPNK